MKRLVLSLFSRERIAGGALVLALLQVSASIVGFLRDQAFSIMFPIDQDPIGVASVYIAAFRPSDLLFQITVMSCLSVVLVPFLSGHIAHKRKEDVNALLSSTMFVFGLLFGMIALVAAIFFDSLAPLFVAFTGETLELYIHFGRIALLTNFLFVFGTALGQLLIAEQRYWIYGLTPVVWGLSTVLGVYLLTPIVGNTGPIFGTVLGTFIYVGIRFLAVRKLGYQISLPRFGLHADLRSMGLLIIPRMLALGAVQLQFLLLDRIASGMGSEFVALNQFARNFESLLPGIVGISLAQAAFSPLSQSAAKGDQRMFIGQLRRSIGMSAALSVPGTIALVLLAGVGAWVMRLSPEVSPIFITCLWIYALAIPFECINHLVLRSFYAVKNTTYPAVSSVVSCIAAVVSGTLLAPTYGIYALAIAYSAAQITQLIVLLLFLPLLLRRSLSRATVSCVPVAESLA
ncbi:MAG: lipid II flippase MurJ [Candidatus Peribacteraceae bacterium]